MRKSSLILLLSVFLLSALVFPAQAVPLDVGVEVDDWFKYEAEVTRWESVDEFLPAGFYGPVNLYDNQTDYIMYNVTDITPDAGGANVTFTITYAWTNGTITYDTLVENVSTTNENIFLIGANMEPGDVVSEPHKFLNYFDIPERTINETINIDYGAEQRDANVVLYTINLAGTDYTYEMHWDKATGMRVYYENYGNVPARTGSNAYNYTFQWTLVDTNLWIIPEFSTAPVMLFMLVAATVCIGIYSRKKLKI